MSVPLAHSAAALDVSQALQASARFSNSFHLVAKASERLLALWVWAPSRPPISRMGPTGTESPSLWRDAIDRAWLRLNGRHIDREGCTAQRRV